MHVAATARWPWLTELRVAGLLMLLLYFGILSFAAVREMTVECRDEPIYLTTERGDRLTTEDGSSFLVAAEKHRSCRVNFGDQFSFAFLP